MHGICWGEDNNPSARVVLMWKTLDDRIMYGHTQTYTERLQMFFIAFCTVNSCLDIQLIVLHIFCSTCYLQQTVMMSFILIYAIFSR